MCSPILPTTALASDLTMLALVYFGDGSDDQSSAAGETCEEAVPEDADPIRRARRVGRASQVGCDARKQLGLKRAAGGEHEEAVYAVVA